MHNSLSTKLMYTIVVGLFVKSKYCTNIQWIENNFIRNSSISNPSTIATDFEIMSENVSTIFDPSLYSISRENNNENYQPDVFPKTR